MNPDSATPRDHLLRTLCIAAIALGLVIRAALLAGGLTDTERTENSDTREYERLADNLWEHGEFSQSSSPPLVPDLQRTPGFPSLWWGLHAVGAHGATGRVMLQALLGLAVCALAAMLGSLIGGWRLGLPVGAVLCLDPLMATYSVMLLAEMPLCLLLTAHLIAIALCFQRPTLIRAVLAGGLLGLAILVKPIAVVLSPLAIAACALAPRSPRARMALALICAAALAIAPGLWMARNARVHGTLVLSSISHRLLYFYHGAAAEAWATGRDIEEVQSEWQERYSEVVRSTPDWPSRLHYLQSEALRSVAAHPLAWIRGCTLGLARIAVAPVRAHLQWIMPHSLVSTPLMGLQFILILFLWAGALRAVLRIRRAPRPTAFTIGVALLAALMLITIAAGANANARFRVPAMPALALVGMWGWLCAGRPGASPEDAQRETS